MSRHTLSMSRQSLIYSLLLVELFVATLNPLSRQTCLGSSYFFSIFYRYTKLICCDRNLLLSNFYYRDIIFLCRDRDFCLQFFIMSQHEFLCRNIMFVIFSTSVTTIFVFVATKFTSALCCVCLNIKLLCRDKVFLCLPFLALNVASRHKICLSLDIRWNVCRNI